MGTKVPCYGQALPLGASDSTKGKGVRTRHFQCQAETSPWQLYPRLSLEGIAAGSANRQQRARRQGVGEQGGIAQRLKSFSPSCGTALALCSSMWKEGTKLWGKDWSTQVSPVTVTSSSLSGCQCLLTTGKVNQCYSRAGKHPAAEEGSGICWSLKKLEAVLAEGGKSQLIPV